MKGCSASLRGDPIVKSGARKQPIFDLANAAAAGENGEDHLAAVRLLA